MYELTTLWLIAAFRMGAWVHCVYALSPPTVMQPEPPAYEVQLYQPELLAPDECPVKVLQSVETLPPDAA